MLRMAVMLAAAMGLAGMLQLTAEAGYAGDRATREYHRLQCPKVRDIKPGNVQYFSGEREAQRSGYRPCVLCLAKGAVVMQAPIKLGKEKVELRGDQRQRVYRLRPRKKITPRKSNPPAIAQVEFNMPTNRSWMDTGVDVPPGAHLEIRAQGNLLDNEPRSLWRRPGPWNPDGLNPAGKPSHRNSRRRLYYLQGKLARTAFRIGSAYDGKAPSGGRLYIRVRDNLRSYGNNRGIYVVKLRVVRPRPPEPKPGEAPAKGKAPPGEGKAKASPPEKPAGKDVLLKIEDTEEKKPD